MRNILLTISYTGTHFHGYQAQPDVRTVEGELQQAIDKIEDRQTKLISAGRTDKGVHALGQRANYLSQMDIDLGNLPRVINKALPEDVSITEAREVPLDFHARFSAKDKHYRFLILNQRHRVGVYANRMAHMPHKLDVNRMEKALQGIQGQHDFSAFVGRFASPGTRVRSIDKVTIERQGAIIQADFYGKSFLKNQIRIIMGTAMEVGRGAMDIDSLYRATLSKKRKDLGPTAEACGLYLMEIKY